MAVTKVSFSDEEQMPTVLRERPPSAVAHGVRASVVGGPDAGKSARDQNGKLIVGRATGVELELTDPTVSSFHVELAARGAGVHVRDLESSNGTHHQGALLSLAVVPPGAVLQLGATTVRVDSTPPLSRRPRSVRRSAPCGARARQCERSTRCSSGSLPPICRS